MGALKVETNSIGNAKTTLFKKFIENSFKRLAFVERYEWLFIPAELENLFRSFKDFTPSAEVKTENGFSQIGKLFSATIIINAALPDGVMVAMDDEKRNLELNYELYDLDKTNEKEKI